MEGALLLLCHLRVGRERACGGTATSEQEQRNRHNREKYSKPHYTDAHRSDPLLSVRLVTGDGVVSFAALDGAIGLCDASAFCRAGGGNALLTCSALVTNRHAHRCASHAIRATDLTLVAAASDHARAGGGVARPACLSAIGATGIISRGRTYTRAARLA